MSDFAASWELSRQRFVTEIAGLNQAQLNWKLHPGALSIGQMAIHTAGVEVSFSSQLISSGLTPLQARIKASATEGVVNDLPFPFSDEEITESSVAEILSLAKEMVEPIIKAPTEDALSREIKSALGPVITGYGALARLGFHAAYHQGQAYLLKTSPGFPA